jgi:predicted nucleotidyltransferase
MDKSNGKIEFESNRLPASCDDVSTENFARSIDDEKLTECVTYLTREQTNLSKDIIVDTGATYKHYKYPLCLYVVTGETVIPVTVSSNPKVYGDRDNVPSDVIQFIINNKTLLEDVANITIDSWDFYDGIEKYLKRSNLDIK